MSDSEWRQKFEAEQLARRDAEHKLDAVRVAHSQLEDRVASIRNDCDELSSLITQMAAASESAPSGPNTASDEEVMTGRVAVAMSASNRAIAEQVLETVELRVDCFAHAEPLVESVTAASTSDAPYLIVLLDMSVTGLDVCQTTRQLRRSGYCGVVIALTAGSSGVDTAKCLEAGCDDYLTSPLHDRRLLKKIQRAIAQVALDL